MKGLKIEILKANPNVCFEFDIFYKTIASEEACDFSMKYQSIVGTGKAVFLEGFDEKRHALNIIMSQYSKKIRVPGKHVKVDSSV